MAAQPVAAAERHVMLFVSTHLRVWPLVQIVRSANITASLFEHSSTMVVELVLSDCFSSLFNKRHRRSLPFLTERLIMGWVKGDVGLVAVTGEHEFLSLHQLFQFLRLQVVMRLGGWHGLRGACSIR